ncbi:glycolate oxidase subunit GlcF [Inmirania thermothiophila]|uniref:Glycolate oxidase iron-sulfur subunit n=1 Tax=Inmirania thermothiophila TaxID=1750597 RepID=A0A3N1Y0N7_9GAMM|nr:glycolate oxidase subunit GlcF [Inmirania thermothiophila]ROR32403.1 glycolate oxidase iron-sulfur subunit [Inmirania thermothiophila]
MQTRLAERFRGTALGEEADAILRACVHCGFCLATCPTYQLLGDEDDSPRGRIYLLKQLFEGEAVGERTRLHLDRCLLCRSCETTCPSGVRYHRLLDLGREVLERERPRPLRQRALRALLRAVLPHRTRFAAALALGRALRPLLPGVLREKVPPAAAAAPWPRVQAARRVLLLEGCVQPVLRPAVDAALARVLADLGVEVVRAAQAGCCGAISHHLGAAEAARDLARRNIDAWWPHLEAGAEAVVASASGCGLMLREYGELLGADPAYAERARRLAERVRDPAELVAALDWRRLGRPGAGRRVAFHVPCTLRHGLRAAEQAEALLRGLGFELLPVADAHLCCGSAGTYSLLEPTLAGALRARRLAALTAGGPQEILTANIGCLAHLAAASPVSVRHWLEAVAEGLEGAGAARA